MTSTWCVRPLVVVRSCHARSVGEPTAEEWAREQLALGASADEVARQLIVQGAGPIETIKALRQTTGKKLGELKLIVDQALPPVEQRANQRLREEVTQLLEAGEPHLVELREGMANVVASGNGPYSCPCCRHYTLDSRGDDAICQVCYWHDDGQDDHDAGVVRGGPNYELSLDQARTNFQAFGACTHRVTAFVRPPRSDELPR